MIERIKWARGAEATFAEWLHYELHNTIGDRAALQAKWAENIVQWKARVIGSGVTTTPFAGAPYSRDTELLTRMGWRSIADVSVGEYVLTRQDGTGVLEWAPVRAKPMTFCPELLHFKSRTIDLMVSPGHTMVLETHDGKPLRKPAHEIWQKHGYHIPLTGTYEGTDTTQLFGLDAGDVAEFVGWYLAEGSCTNSGALGIAQTKPAGRRALEALFGRLGFTWSYSGNTYYVHSRGHSGIPQELKDWCCDGRLCNRKSVPKFFYGASPRIIKRLLDGMIAGDGTVRYTADSKQPIINYFTTSAELAGDVQALAQLLGMRASIRVRDRTAAAQLVAAGGVVGDRKIAACLPSYEVQLLWRSRAKLKPQTSHAVVPYNDIAYCVTVKNHAVYVRRNGKACWCGNSDLEMPLTARHVDPVYADFMQTIHLPQDFWSIVGKRPDTVDIAKPVQEFLSRIEHNYLGMRKVNTKAFLDLIIHGTAIYKDLIVHDRRKVRSRTEEVVPMLRHQPAVQHVPLEQFIIPAYAYDIDPNAANGAAPWVAQEFYLTPVQLRERASAEAPWLPAYDRDGVDAVLSYDEDTLGERPVDEKRQEEDLYQPFQHRRITLYEVWARFDVDDDGIEEDIVVIWHHKSRTILRALHNPLLHGKRPFSAQPYLPGLGFYGIGMCDLDEWAQLASSRVLNNVIDNTLLANTIMIGAPQGMNIQPDEPIYPYKIWTLGPQEDLKAIQMGRSNPGSLQLLQMFSQWSDQGSGVSELRQGDISNLPSRTPAATTMSMLQEGKKRFDMILGNLREGPLADIGVRVLQNLVQISKDDPRWKAFAVEALGQQDGAAVVSVLDGPVHDIEAKFGLTVTATSSQVNKEVEKQSLVFLAQLMQQMYPAQLQYAQMLGDQQLALATAVAAYRGTVELQRRILEAHDIQNPDAYVPQLAQGQATMQLPGMGAPGAAGAAPVGGPGAAAPLAQAPQQLAAALGVF